MCLRGVYEATRDDVVDILGKLYEDVKILDDDVFLRALQIYNKSPKLDFVDCLLYGYKLSRNVKVFTFDKKLLRVLKKTEH